MRDILVFVSGAAFSLAVAALSLFASFRVTEYREEREVRVERKRKAATARGSSGGAVVRPKTPEEMRLAKDEEFQEFTRIINEP